MYQSVSVRRKKKSYIPGLLPVLNNGDGCGRACCCLLRFPISIALWRHLYPTSSEHLHVSSRAWPPFNALDLAGFKRQIVTSNSCGQLVNQLVNGDAFHFADYNFSMLPDFWCRPTHLSDLGRLALSKKSQNFPNAGCTSDYP